LGIASGFGENHDVQAGRPRRWGHRVDTHRDTFAAAATDRVGGTLAQTAAAADLAGGRPRRLPTPAFVRPGVGAATALLGGGREALACDPPGVLRTGHQASAEPRRRAVRRWRLCCLKGTAGTACGASPGPSRMHRSAGRLLADRPAAPRQSQTSSSRSTPGGPAQPHRRSAARPATATGSPRTRTHPPDPGR
jgi:hypothetical protein